MFDESLAKITNELTGRTVEYVYYDKLDLVIRTICGHEIRLAATTTYMIAHKRTDVRIALPGVDMFSKAGRV